MVVIIYHPQSIDPYVLCCHEFPCDFQQSLLVLLLGTTKSQGADPVPSRREGARFRWELAASSHISKDTLLFPRQLCGGSDVLCQGLSS